MPTVAELKVLVEAETGQLEAGLRRADRAVQELARSAEASARQMSLGWQAAATAAGVLAASLATKLVGAVTGAATSVLRLGISTNAMMEQAKAGFTTLIGSAQEAEHFLQQLADFARKTPFTMESALAGARNLMAMGFSARDTIPWLQTLGNVTAALGAGSDVYFQLAYAIGQIQAKGRLAGQELLQLANAGVNINEVFAILSQQTGKSIDELKKLQEQGKITSAEFLQAFKLWADSRFGDAMAQQAQTFRGALSNLSDTLKLLLADAVQPLFDGLRRLVVAAAELAESPGLQRFVETVRQVLGVAINEIGLFMSRIASWVRQHLSWDDLREAFLRFVVVLRAGWEIVRSVLSTVGQTIATAVQSLTRALSPAAAAVRDTFGQIANETGKSGKSFAWWAGFVSGAIDTVIRGLGGLLQAFTRVMGAILHVVVSVGSLIARALVAFLSPFSRHSPSLVEQVEAGVARIVQAWQSLPGLIRSPLETVRTAIQALGGTIEQSTSAVADVVKRVTRQAFDLFIQLTQPGQLASWEETFALLRDTASGVGAALEGLAAQARQVWNDFQAGTLSVEEARKRLEELQQQSEGLTPAIDTVQTAFTELGKAVKAELDTVQREIEETQRALEQLLRAPITGETAFTEKLAEAERQRDLLAAAVKAMEAGTESTFVSQIRAAIEQVDQAIAQATEAGASPEQIARLEDLRNAYETALRYVNQDLETLKDQLARADDRVAALRATSDVTFGLMHEELKRLTEVPVAEQPFGDLFVGITKLQEELQTLGQERDQLQGLYDEITRLGEGFGEASQYVDTLIERLDQLIPRLERVGGGGGGGGAGIELPTPEDLLAVTEDERWVQFESPPAPFTEFDLMMRDFNKGFEEAKSTLTDIEGTLQSVAGDLGSIADYAERFANKLDDWQSKLENVQRTMEVLRGFTSLILGGPAGAAQEAATQQEGTDPFDLIFGEGWEERYGTKLKERILTRFEDVKQEIGSWFTQQGPWFSERGGEMGEQIGSGLAEKRLTIKQKIEEAGSGIADWIAEQAGKIQGWGQEVGQHIGDGLQEKRSTLSERAGNAFAGISDWISGNAATIEGWGKSVGSAIGDKIGNLRSWLSERAGDFLSGIGDWITNNWNTIVGWGSKLVEAINEGLSKIDIKWPKIPVPSIEITWKDVKIPGDGSISVPSFGLKWMARGGIVTAPSIVGVGEAGPEAILPLSGRGVNLLAEALAVALSRLDVEAGRSGGRSNMPMFVVRVMIGDRELRDIVRTEMAEVLR